MGAITIPNVSDRVAAQLAELARMTNRTVEEEAALALAVGAGQRLGELAVQELCEALDRRALGGGTRGPARDAGPARLPADFEGLGTDSAPHVIPDFDLELPGPGERVAAQFRGRLPFDPGAEFGETDS